MVSAFNVTGQRDAFETMKRRAAAAMPVDRWSTSSVNQSSRARKGVRRRGRRMSPAS